MNRIDRILYNNRQDGIVFQENPEEVREYLEQFFNSLNNFEYDDGNISINICVDITYLD